jgi:transcriptional regulator with GAF, ATPase, and Fis domain
MHAKKVDVRQVAVTNRDLEKMMDNREFRSSQNRENLVLHSPPHP